MIYSQKGRLSRISNSLICKNFFQVAIAYTPFEKLQKIIDDRGQKGLQIQRFKGLGEMNPHELWETTMDPEKRILKRVMIDEENSSEIDVTFTTLMGDKVEPRREFIEKHATYANIDA